MLPNFSIRNPFSGHLFLKPKAWSTHFFRITIPLHMLFGVSIYQFFFYTERVSYSYYLLSLLLVFLFSCLGVAIGYHRLLSHRSFETTLFIKRGLATLGIYAGQGPPTVWAYIHRSLHHPFSDTSKDPHSTIKGFFHAFIGWQINFKEDVRPRAIVDLLRDDYLKWISQNYYLLYWILPLFVGLFDWRLLIFSLVPALVIANHVENFVNCLCHTPTLGYQNYNLNDRSTNIQWMGWLLWGQGYHNNHHAKPREFDFAMNRGEFDLCAPIVRCLQKNSSNGTSK